LFRKTPASLRKLKALASGLGAVILRPYYRASGLYRVAALSDIIRSKRAAGRARDLAVLELLERTLDEESRLKKGQAGSSQEGE
jgi:hypothetical protein